MEYNNTDGIRHYGANSHEWIGVVLDPKVQHSEVGMQVKVAIMGYHPTDTSVVRDEDIQYAQILLPVTAGNGGGNMNQTVSLSVGTAVYGKFTDGSARQQPMILGQFPLTSKTRYGKGRFEAKDGFGGNLKPGNLLGRDTALGLNTRPCVPRALPGAGDKTKKRETPKDALEAAGVDTTDNKAKVEDSKTPENNGLSAEEQKEFEEAAQAEKDLQQKQREAQLDNLTTEQLTARLDPTVTGASNPDVFNAARSAREEARAAGLSEDEVQRKVLIATVAASEIGAEEREEARQSLELI